MNTNYTITGICAFLAYMWLFWVVYVTVMGLYRAHLDNRLGRTAKVLGGPILLVGWLMDVACNFTVAWIVFLDPPQEWLITNRLKRYKQHTGWRSDIADWLCSKLLDPFDPTGKHC
jgi:hypothetical protein